MKPWRRKFSRAFACTISGAMLGVTLHAQETNMLEIISRLQKQVQELQQRVQTLEGEKAAAASTNAAPSQQRLEQLDQQVKILQRQRELDAEAAEAQARNAPRIIVGEQGFSFSSANTNFAVQLKGVLQVDSRTFFDDAGIVGNDGFLLRRARPILQGTVFRDFDFLFVPDFGTGNNGGNGGSAPTPQIFDAYLNYRYSPALQLRAGKFKSPIGLEQLQSDRDITFNERALPTDLVPTRDLGFELHGEPFEGVVNYAAGIFNGVGDARNSSLSAFQDDKAFEGRLFLLPFKKASLPALSGLGFGVGGSYQDMQGTNTAGLPNNNGYATVGQQQFFAYNPTNGTVVAAGRQWRFSSQGYYYFGPFGLLGEYVISDQRVALAGAGTSRSADLRHTAWEITGSWLLTGEDATYGAVVPRHPFNLNGDGWGAWQLAARYSQLDIDDEAFPFFANPSSSASKAQEWSVGLNWYLNRNIRADLSFSRTTFEGGGGRGSSAPAIVTREPEQVLFTRVQLAF